jgi:hypothetical protein
MLHGEVEPAVAAEQGADAERAAMVVGVGNEGSGWQAFPGQKLT